MPPRKVSAPSPPSMVSVVSAARFPRPVIVSAPSWPRTTRLSTAAMSNRAVAAAIVLTSGPLETIWIWSSPSVPMYVAVSTPSPPSTLIGAGPVMPTFMAIVVRAAEGGHADVVERRLAAEDACLHGQPVDLDETARVPERDSVDALRSLCDDGVGLGVAASADRVEVDVDALGVGAGEVVDDDRVGAAERAVADVLDVDVHDDVADVAGEADALAVGGDVDQLADRAAEKVEAVVAALAVDGVVVVTGVPDEAVVAATELSVVVAVAAGDDVVAAAADEGLVADAADQRVVARAALDRDELVGERAAALVDPHLVVAAAGVDVDRREGVAVDREVGRAVGADVDLEHRRRAQLEPQDELVAAAVAGDRECSRVHLGRVCGRGLARPPEGCGEEGHGEGAQREHPPFPCRGSRTVHCGVVLSR